VVRRARLAEFPPLGGLADRRGAHRREDSGDSRGDSGGVSAFRPLAAPDQRLVRAAGGPGAGAAGAVRGVFGRDLRRKGGFGGGDFDSDGESFSNS